PAAVKYDTGANPNFVAVGDFNGDGRGDLAIANFNSSTVSVLLGNGNGTFQPNTCTTCGTGTNPSALAVADFNGDGRSDLATANYGNGGSISILLGSGG